MLEKNGTVRNLLCENDRKRRGRGKEGKRRARGEGERERGRKILLKK